MEVKGFRILNIKGRGGADGRKGGRETAKREEEELNQIEVL